MSRAINLNSKKAFREDATYARQLLRDMERELANTTPNWDNIETIARDLEGLGSSIACRANENTN